MYVNLCEGKPINKSEVANKYGVDERSIQRDIDDIRAFLDERSMFGDGRTIEYDRTKKGFVMAGDEASMMNNSEILAVSKILLESRSMRKDEIMPILEKLLDFCVPVSNQKAVKKLVANEQLHYVPPKHNKYILKGLWDLLHY